MLTLVILQIAVDSYKQNHSSRKVDQNEQVCLTIGHIELLIKSYVPVRSSLPVCCSQVRSVIMSLSLCMDQLLLGVSSAAYLTSKVRYIMLSRRII